MRPAHIAIVLVVLAGIGCSFHACQQQGSYTHWQGDQLKVRRAIDVTSDVPLTGLDLDVSYSSVTITSDPSITQLRVTGHVREETENECSIEFTATGPRLVTRSNPPARFDGITLHLPPGKNIDCRTGSGSITVSKLSATDSVTLKSGYGSITLGECAPIKKIDLNTSSGSLTVRKIERFDDLTLRTSYGSIELSDLTGASPATKLNAKTSSGSIELSNVHKCELTAVSSYGSVTLETANDVSAVSLTTSSGKLRAAHVTTPGDVTLKTGYGSAELSDVSQAKKVDVRSSSGSITIEKVNAGDASFSTSYGSISLSHCAFATLSTHTSSGKISQSDVQVQR